MSGTFYTGRTGKLRIESRIMAKIRDWSIETTVELISTNTIDSRFNSFVPGVAGATGSATVMYYRDTTNTDKQDFTHFISNIMTTSENGVTTSNLVDLELRVDNTPTTGNTDIIRCKGYITSMGIQVSTGEVTTIPISFTVSETSGKLFSEVPS